jgi:aldose 1-epimerase
MSLVKQIQELNYKGKSVKVFELSHTSGLRAVISNYGCILMKLQVPDKMGAYRDVVLGFDKIENYWDEKYLQSYPYFGAIIGRYANRIKGASFVLDGQIINTSNNQQGNTLHGGFEGFDKKVWDVVNIKEEENPSISFEYISVDTEEGFPGNLKTIFTLTLLENSLKYTIEATTDMPTAVNLTYHPYFNLDSGASINKQKAKINAKFWLEQDADFCANGNLIPTAKTNYDFSNWKFVAQDWNKEDGYDQSFVVDKKKGELEVVAEAISSDANLHLQVLSTEDLVHFYTGRWIPHIQGKNEVQYGSFSGYCFETQGYPNAVNIESFPNTILRPGDTYKQTTIYQFNK